jgi:hypothetical protein
MTKSVFVLVVLAAAVSTSAVAKELKQNKQAPTVSATQMTNSEMDKVTAGVQGCCGNAWGAAIGAGFAGHGNAKGQGADNNNGHARF